MKTKTLFLYLTISFSLFRVNGQNTAINLKSPQDIDYITALKDTLNHLAVVTDNEYFRLHCESIVTVIESKAAYTSFDSSLLEDTYHAFNNETDTCNPKDFSTYVRRRRSMIISWVSPTDGAVSFSWLKLPKNWDPEQEYPLYTQLHGLWNVAGNKIQYLTYPYLNNPSTSISFEDGYLLSPWGRGNLWYQGISETDIWECIAIMEEIVYINPARKYLSGHSMGGYGAWHIATGSSGVWAALGIHAGALWYGGSAELNSTVAEILKDVPIYFVCGTNDGLLGVNQTAYQLLLDAGNQNVEFVTFNGGHEYLEENVINMYLWMKDFINEYPDDVIPKEISVTAGNMRYYPNPFNDGIHIQLYLYRNANVTLKIYNAAGQEVKTLISGTMREGEHFISWKPQNLSGGIYYCLFKCDHKVHTGKLIYHK